ncbi:MAG: TrkH family potassium uptake protein [Halanaerobiales bacterium]|nr:TrkH family potassium uptake protein [Halanaerobiales bacterium]
MRYINILKERYQLIIKYIGILTMAASAFLLLPLLSLPFYPEEIKYSYSFLIPSIFLFIIGYIFWKYTKHNREEVSLSLKEGGIIVLISWLIAVISSALPFMLIGMLNFTQAIFESMSGWTTTGLSVVDVTTAPKLILLWRSIMQFFGGAGLVVVMMSSVLHPYGFGLYKAEGRSDQLLPHVKRSTKAIMYIYTGYTVAGILLYVLTGMSLFDAFNHSLAALSTGGFSTQVDSIGHYNSLSIEVVTWILMLLGTTNFATHFALLKGKFKIFFKNGEIRLLLILNSIFIPILIFFSVNKLYSSLPAITRRSIFETITAISTTGFSLDTFNTWNAFGTFSIIILMLIGGGTGSTAGGIKLYRIYLIFKSIIWEIKGYFLPADVVKKNYIWRGETKLDIKSNFVMEAANYVVLYIFTYFLGVLIFLSQGYSISDSMFEFASALGTVGLSIGITAVDAPPIILWTETLGMFLGRLEFFVIFFAIIKIFKDINYIYSSK